MSQHPDSTPRTADSVAAPVLDLIDVQLVGVQLTRTLRSTTGVTITCTSDMRGFGPDISVSVDKSMTTVEQRLAIAADLAEVLDVERYVIQPGTDRELTRLLSRNWRQTGVGVTALINTRDEADEAVAA